MSKTLLLLFLCLNVNGIASYGQFTYTSREWEIISTNVLQENAEVVLLRENAKYDSLTIFEFSEAFGQCKAALSQAEITYGLEQTLKADVNKKLEISESKNKKLKKEIRKQKGLKWLGFGMTVFFGYLAIRE